MKDTDQEKRAYRSEKAWVQIGERRLLWVDHRVDTDQGLGTD